MTKVAHLSIAKDLVRRASLAPLMEHLTDPHGYILDVNKHISRLLSCISKIPSFDYWDVLTPAALREYVKDSNLPTKIGIFWLDHTNQAQVFCALMAWKTDSLLRSLIRSVNSNDLIAPALLSRALVEHASAAVVSLTEAIGIFDQIATSDKPTIASSEQMTQLEQTLLKAIWGSRIGTSKLHDGKTPLWEQMPYRGETIHAENIVGVIKKVARFAGDDGKAAFKVYEWLCDIVHPATQGFRIFWEPATDVAPGYRRFPILRGGSRDQALTHALVFWGVGYACVALQNTFEKLNSAVSSVHARLESVYGIPQPLPKQPIKR